MKIVESTVNPKEREPTENLSHCLKKISVQETTVPQYLFRILQMKAWHQVSQGVGASTTALMSQRTQGGL